MRDFEELWRCYLSALEVATKLLREKGIRTTGRIKSQTTLVDKLRQGSSLKSIQDFAGARVVLMGGRGEQNLIVEEIVELFEGQARSVRVIDRREAPSYGYRAVHLIVHCLDLPVEIQVRTALQDQWAQLVEKMGDLWGRGIRYGKPPQYPDAPVPGSRSLTRGDTFAIRLELSEAIADYEAAQIAAETGHPDWLTSRQHEMLPMWGSNLSQVVKRLQDLLIDADAWES